MGAALSGKPVRLIYLLLVGVVARGCADGGGDRRGGGEAAPPAPGEGEGGGAASGGEGGLETPRPWRHFVEAICPLAVVVGALASTSRPIQCYGPLRHDCSPWADLGRRELLHNNCQNNIWVML